MRHFSAASMFDRAILSVSPQRGLRRIEARLRAGALMNFDGASNGRRVKGWKAPATDADAASFAGRARLRQLSRDMIRNAPFARRAQTVVTNNVVGQGIQPSIKFGNKRKKAKIEEQILGHLKSKDLDRHGQHDLFAAQSLVMNAVFESGEVLVLRRHMPSRKRLKLPFQIEILEIDRLDPNVTEAHGNEVVDGIEYDADGSVVAYHILDQHPGALTRFFKLKAKSSRWKAVDVLHIKRLERPEQTRGVPWLAPVMLTLGEMRDYQEAQLLKQKISALLVGVVSSTEGVSKEQREASGPEEMAPGALVYLDEGQKIEFSDPPTTGEFDVVIRLSLLAIAMGLGITYESLAGDLSRVNFASSKVGRIEMDANVKAWQSLIMIGQFCEGIGKWAVEAYRLTPNAEKGVALNWTPPARPMIDPSRELKPVQDKINGKLTSRQRAIREMGQDPDVIDQEIEEDEVRDAERAKRVAQRTGQSTPPSETAEGEGDEGK